MKKTNINEIKDLVNLRGYEFIEIIQEKHKRTLLRYKCIKHGERIVQLTSFKQGCNCKLCANENIGFKHSYTTEIYKQKVKALVGEEYTVIGEYTLANNKILMKHNICDKEYEVTPGHFIDGNRCPYCTGRYKTTEDFKKEVYDLVGNEYLVLGRYIKASIKILMQHTTCGTKYEVTPNKFLQNRRCPECTDCFNSNLSIAIEKFLFIHGINYQREYKFEDCKYINVLPFDFAIFKNNILYCLIEADGPQHFKVSKLFGGKKGFEITKKRDEIKNKYCFDNNIYLIRIPYFNYDDINIALKDKLKDLITIEIKNNVFDKELRQNRKLSNDDIYQIRYLYTTKQYDTRELGDKFNVSKTTISSILKYKLLPDIAIEFKETIFVMLSSSGRKKGTVTCISKEEQNNIKQLYDTGLYSLRALGRMFNTDHNTIKRIINY